MSMDGWEREELRRLTERVAALENMFNMLDRRTVGLIRLGGGQQGFDPSLVDRLMSQIKTS